MFFVLIGNFQKIIKIIASHYGYKHAKVTLSFILLNTCKTHVGSSYTYKGKINFLFYFIPQFAKASLDRRLLLWLDMVTLNLICP